jgi:transcriptional regulator with XRE-family HTH domain
MEALRLKEWMRAKGISGKDLAKRMNVTPATISNIANNNHFPQRDLLYKLAEELDIDVRELFNPTKEDSSEPLYVQRDGQYVAIGKINREL